MKLFFSLIAVAVLFAGCLSLSPQANVGNASAESQSNGTVLFRISFPAGAHLDNQTFSFNTSECPHAYECLSRAVKVSCAWFDSVGVLACNGVSRSCFITSIDGVDGGTAGGSWAVYVNGGISPVGISCLAPRPNDVLDLAVTSSPLFRFYEKSRLD